MAQRKKPQIREAILAAAFRLFSSKGYAATMVADIARLSIAGSQVVARPSPDMMILYAIYDPWLRARVDALERQLAAVKSPRVRLRSLLIALWREIPAEENGFLNNIMQAISASDPSEGYRTTLVRWLEKRVTVMIDDALPAARRRRLSKVRLAHVLIMAFDGFAIDYHLHPRRRSIDDRTIDVLTEMLLGDGAG